MRSARNTPGPIRRRGVRLVSILLALCLACSCASAGVVPDDESEEPAPYWRTNLFRRFLSDQRYLVTTWWPREMGRGGFTIPLALATTAAVTSGGVEPGVDLRLERSIGRWSGGRQSGVAGAFTRLGDTRTAVVLLGTTHLIARWGGNERLSRATSLSAEALLSSGLYNLALKRVTRRTRPLAGGRGDFFVDRPGDGQSARSFPSGHAMGAFAVATVFAEEYRDRRWVPWVAYSTAGLVGSSRMSLGRHFPSDVVVGALLGHSIGRMVWSRERGVEERPLDRIEPILEPDGGGGYGIAWSRRW